MTIKMIPPEDRPDFRSMAKAMWRDVNGKEHQRYVIQPMQPGLGFKVIDTDNDANFPVRQYLETIEGAQEFLRITQAP